MDHIYKKGQIYPKRVRGSADKTYSGVKLTPCQGVPEIPKLENKVEIGVYLNLLMKAYLEGTPSQSFRKRSIPISVRGCFIICLITPIGTVAISQPALAA